MHELSVKDMSLIQFGLDNEYVTPFEAAQLLGISKVTLHRWVKRGMLPAYAFGPRRILIKRSDLAHVVKPVSKAADAAEIQTHAAPWVRLLTEGEVQRGLEALKKLDELHEALRKRRNGIPFPNSAELIRKEREKRTKCLLKG